MIKLIPDEPNTLELSNALRCHGTWLAALVQHVVDALSGNPHPEREVGRVPLCYEAVAGLLLVFAQLLKAHAATIIIWIPVETNTIELSNVLRCHGTWLSFLVEPVVAALSRNPLPELGVGNVPL